MSQEYFFELLTEEMPAWMLTTRISVLREQLVKLLTDYAGSSPSAEQIHVDATSRRIFFVLRDLPAQQPNRAEELKGPSSKAAWTADGSAGPALLGFLKKNNATIEQTTRRDDYVWLNRIMPGLRADVMLQAAIPKLIESSDLAVGCASGFLDARKKLGFPLLPERERALYLETSTVDQAAR